jgi:hypothetical protein
MISQGDLIAAARELAGTTGGPPPTQASLRRAVSTTDYALFHCMAENCADMLVGTLGTNRSQPAWQQAYRALQHGTAKQRCRQDKIQRFPLQIQRFVDRFVTMQEKRESADYDPAGTFEQLAVIGDINLSEDAITQFRQAPEQDRRSFAVYVLLNLRNT